MPFNYETLKKDKWYCVSHKDWFNPIKIYVSNAQFDIEKLCFWDERDGYIALEDVVSAKEIDYAVHA